MPNNEAKLLTDDRKQTHGDWVTQAYRANMLKGFLHSMDEWKELAPFQQESLDMIMTKISRIMTGNPNEEDHWDDIGGYAYLGKGGHVVDQ